MHQRKMGNEIFLWFVLEFGRNVQRIFERRLFQSCCNFKYGFIEMFCLVNSPSVQAVFLSHMFL